MKLKSILTLLVLFIMCVCLLVPSVFAEEESAAEEAPGWETFLEKLGIDDWVSEEEKQEVHEFYTYWAARGSTLEELLHVKERIRLHREMDGSFVYDPPKEPEDLSQLTLYEMLDRSTIRISLAEETIQQWYYADFFDLVKLGHLEFQPNSMDSKVAPVSYTAKVVTQDNRFGGNVQFYYNEEGIPKFILLNWSLATDTSPSASSVLHLGSFYYGDYKEEITEELKKYGEGPVSEDHVKLAVLGHYLSHWGLGGVRILYIEGQKGAYIFLIPTEEDPRILVYPVDDALCAQAETRYQEYMEYREKQDAWKEDHPDEFVAGGGPGIGVPDEDEDTGTPVPTGSETDTDPDSPVPDTPAETGETVPVEPDTPPAAGLPAALALTVAVCAAAVLFLTGALRLFGR